MSERAAFVITLLPTADRDGIKDLRFLLKIAGRHLHLRAIDIREQQTVHRRDARRRIAQATSVETELKMVSLRKFGPQSRYLNFEDLKDRPPLRERIGLVKVENGKFGERAVLVFEPSGQMLSLNVTSVGNLMRGFGEESDDWIGKLVEVYAGEVETKSGTMDAVLVKAIDAPADAAIAAKAKAAKSKSLDDEIPF